MPRGGYRVGSGRPPGAVNKLPRSSASGATKIGGQQTPLSYLLALLNDEEAEPIRRDRAAMALLPYTHARPTGQPASYNYTPMRDQAALKAKWAGFGSSWWRLLHTPEQCDAMEAELKADPQLRAWVEAEARRDGGKESAMEAAPRERAQQAAAEETDHITATAADRNRPTATGWGDDLVWRPRGQIDDE